MASSLQLAAILACLCGLALAQGPISFAPHYGSHMVLQRAPRQAYVSGYTNSVYIGERIVISLIDANDFADHTEVFVIAENNNADRGMWTALLVPTQAGGPYRVQATILSTGESAEIDDVYFGDVWLCGGDSNMEMPTNNVFNSTEEMAGSYSYPQVRLFMQAQVHSETPQNDTIPYLTWSKASPATVATFSAVCWMYGRKVNEHLKVPIGLMQATWGGTRIESWSSPEALTKCGEVPSTRPEQDQPSVLWNTMIHPLLHTTITGVIWYQGETNALRKENTYSCRFPAMIDDYRKRFSEGTYGQTVDDFTFGFVQIAPENPNPRYIGGYPSLRWMQTDEYGFAPNRRMLKTFMAVTYDTKDTGRGFYSNPRDKSTVASRLVLGMRAVHLRDRKAEFQGHMPEAYNLNDNGTVLTFRYSNRKPALDVRSHTGFEVCCGSNPNEPCTEDDGRWTSAPIEKSDKHTVTLSTQCENGKMVGHRYNWRATPCAYKKCAIYSNGHDLPAPPYVKFGDIRKDSRWHAITFDRK